MDGNKFVGSRVGECIEGPVMLQDLESTVISVYDVVGRVKATYLVVIFSIIVQGLTVRRLAEKVGRAPKLFRD